MVCGSLHCMTQILIHTHSQDSRHATLPHHPSSFCLLQGPGSFLASPIRDSPVQGIPPHDQLPPPGPHGRLPPPGPYRPPRPGPYHLPPGPPLPANGHPGMPLPGPMGGDFGPRPTNGHALQHRPMPGHVMDPRGPPPPHFRPPPPHHFGPMPPPHGVFCLSFCISH